MNRLLLLVLVTLSSPGVALAQADEAEPPPAPLVSADGKTQKIDAAGDPLFDSAGDPIWELSDQEQALQLFDEAVQSADGLGPGSTAWNFGIIPKFTRALELVPDFHEARYNLGMAYLQLNDLELAIRELDKVVRAAPEMTDARIGLGLAYERSGDKSAAEAVYLQGIGYAPEDVDLLNGRARVLLSQGRATEAERAAKAILKINSNSLDAFNTLGLAYLELERFETARFVFQKAKSLPGADDNASLEANLGLVFFRMGREFQAEASFAAALELDPNHAGARVNLAHLRLVNLDYEGALELLEDVQRQLKGNQTVQLSYAVALRGVGRLEEAETIYELIASDPTSDLRTQALLNLAILQGDFLKDYAAAVDTYNEYVSTRQSLGDPVSEDDPVHEYLKDVEKLLRKQERRRQREAEAAAEPEPEPEPEPEGEAAPSDPEDPASVPESTDGETP